MATYTQGPQPSFFEVPTFDAPTEFQFQIARQKQLQFDKGIDNVRSQYQSLSNLPVSSQYAMSKRDAYMQDATQKLKSIAGADFSLQENQSLANSIYKPLTSDQDILYDLSQTKNAQKQTSIMDQLQSSKDEKQRSQYWDTGREYVNDSIQQLQNAKTPEQLRSTQVRNFVPYSDIIGKLNKAATDLKLKVSVDHLNGGYIITKENGEDANIPFYLFAQSQLGTQDREVLNVLGTVDADRSIKMETVRNGGDEGLARTSLAQQAINKQFETLSSQSGDNSKALAAIESKRKALIDGNKGVIDNTIFDSLDKLDTQKEMIAQNSSIIDDNLRDLGYGKVNGEYVQNQNYNKTLSYYKQDLSIPYSAIASKNITNAWAAGLAASTAQLGIKADPNFAKGLDLQIEEMKLRQKVQDATATSAGTTKKGAAPKEDFIDEPLQLGNNPYGRQSMTAYDYYQQQKKSYETDLYSKGTDLIQDAGLGLSADFLTTLSDNMKKGAANESIMGQSIYSLKNNPEFKGDIDKINAMINNGQLTAPQGSNDGYKYADLFRALIARAKNVTDDKLKNAGDGTDPAELSQLVKTSKEVEQNLNAFRVFKDDESKINQKLLSKPDYSSVVQNGQLMSKEDFLTKYTGFSSPQDYIQKRNQDAAGAEALMRNRVGAIASVPGRMTEDFKNVLGRSPVDSIVNDMGDQYDKIKAKFDNDFSNYVNTEKPSFMSKLPMQNGQIGFTYPINEWGLRKNPETGEKETGEKILSRAFSPENISDETKILNLDDLGDKSNTMALIRAIPGTLGEDVKPEDGKVYTVQVGSDGKSPSVIFRPSVEFLKNFVAKGNPLSASALNKIAQYGIEVAADLPEVTQNKPSLVGRLIDMDKSYNVLPELKDQGFGATIEKQTNGRGYKIYLDYKTIDPSTGKETVETHKDIHPELSIPEQRLDTLSSSVISDIINQYVSYNTQKKAIQTSAIPQKTYTEEEYQILRKTRQ